jgi:hypothetical protein
MGLFKKIRKAAHKALKVVPGVGQVYSLVDTGARATGLTGAINKALKSNNKVKQQFVNPVAPSFNQDIPVLNSSSSAESYAFNAYNTEQNPFKKSILWIKYQYIKAKFLTIGVGVGLLIVLFNRFGLFSSFTSKMRGGRRW